MSLLRRTAVPYGHILELVRQQIENAPGRFTARDIFERVRFEPGIVLASVERALRRLRNAGEVVVADKNGASRPMVLKCRKLN